MTSTTGTTSSISRTQSSSAQTAQVHTTNEEATSNSSKQRLDGFFHAHLRAKYPTNNAKDPVEAAVVPHLKEMGSKIDVVDRMFDGDSVQTREQGAKEGLALRKAMVTDLFQKCVRPAIQELMTKHKDVRSFDKVVAVAGFNRLWVRDRASAGTDNDFIMFIDSDNTALIDDIRTLMKTEVRPRLQFAGLDMETADYLMTSVSKYSGKLTDTRNALFTLANMHPENTCFVTGSQSIHTKAFTLSDELLVEHYTTLLINQDLLSESNAPRFKRDLAHKLEANGSMYRKQIVDHLQKMASSELYIGKKPYNKKQTIQTIFSKLSRSEIQKRSASFSIKFSINRIVDLIFSAGINPSSSGIPFTRAQVNKLENLGLVLSNIICRQNASAGHPMLTVQEGYSDITLANLQKMSKADRKIVAELLAAFDISLKPSDANFAEKCYDALWSLGNQMHVMAQRLEKAIYTDAFKFANTPSQQGSKNTTQ